MFFFRDNASHLFFFESIHSGLQFDATPRDTCSIGIHIYYLDIHFSVYSFRLLLRLFFALSCSGFLVFFSGCSAGCSLQFTSGFLLGSTVSSTFSTWVQRLRFWFNGPSTSGSSIFNGSSTRVLYSGSTVSSTRPGHPGFSSQFLLHFFNGFSTSFWSVQRFLLLRFFNFSSGFVHPIVFFSNFCCFSTCF